ncbi:MAG TPA: hypothetical protein DCZ94_00595 [Lentisphaeria bacterium]|nr:MAG: hypothetical protein A2X48_12160 [Lentisphaerae bacterium GWF2_49_21]HBC85430.1 hypothetical protein [Lentisphaeria bacterium]
MHRNGPENFFMGWDRPLVELVAAKFAEGWDPGKGPLDLGRTLVIVSTSGAGRELRTALAKMSAEKNSYMIPPAVLTSEPFLLPRGNAANRIASEAEILSAWSKVLLETKSEGYSSIFPVRPRKRDFPWSLSTAELFVELRRVLAEKGLSIRHVSENIELDEPERWAELAKLEDGYLMVLAENGLEDPESAKKKAVDDPEPFNGFDRIILAGMPDPVPMAIEKLGRMIETKSICVWINAPPGMKGFFDGWGRPIPSEWSGFHLELDKEKIISAFTPEDQAEKVVRQVADFGRTVDVSDLSITAANPNLFQSIRESLESLASSQGQEFLIGNPSGISVKNTCIYNIVSTLSSFLTTREFQYAESLARIPEVLCHLVECREADCAKYISAIDDFKLTCLPFSLSHSRKLLSSYKASSGSRPNPELAANYVKSLESLVSDYEKSKSVPEFMRALLGRMFSGKTLDPAGSVDDSEFKEAGRAFGEILESLETDAFLSLCVKKEEQLGLMTRLFENLLIHPETEGESLEISGWLELPWKTSSKIVIAGMNEGYVPDSISGDVFLPNTMRTKLGLRSNDDKFARDLFLFASIINSRRKKGDVRIIVGRQDFDGKPMKPSRILFTCPEDEFVARVERLFTETQMHPPPEPPNSHPAWKLRPEWKPDTIRKISVTAFKDYLECPFRFYLKRVIRMEDQEYGKFEMDAMEFGNICHDSLVEIINCAGADADDIGKILCSKASDVLKEKYGKDLLVPLMIQEYSLMQRLKKAAVVEAEQRGLGWRTVDVEYSFGNGNGIILDGMPVTGKIDRIDYNPLLKKVRILDYKTSETGKDPRKTHFRKGEWIDLQLPLYRILFDKDDLLKKKIPGEFNSVECGYFNLPKAVTSTGIVIWKELDEVKSGAETKAVEIIGRIRKNIFWPPSSKVDNEISKWLFPYEPQLCIDEEFGGAAAK